MKSDVKGLLSLMKSPPDNIPDEALDKFFKEFCKWIHSLNKTDSGKKENFFTKKLISDCLSSISNVCKQCPTKILKNFQDLSEILKLLLSVYNDPELRATAWDHTINIINALNKSIEYTAWGDVINAAFNYDRNHDRINVGSNPEFIAKTYVEQTNSILQQCSLNNPIQFYYWILIYSKYINTMSFKIYPSLVLSKESLYGFINVLKQTFEIEGNFPNPLQPIPTYSNGGVISKFNPDLAFSFLHAIVFIQNNVSKSSKEQSKVTQTMKSFLSSAFQYWTFIVSNDQELLNNPQLVLSVTSYLPQPQTQEMLNTFAKYSKLIEELIDICISLFSPLYNAIDTAKDKQKALPDLTSHIYLTRMIVSQSCKRMKNPNPLIYFSNHATNKFPKPLIPVYSNLMFAILIDVSSDNTDTVEIITPDVYHYLSTDLSLVMELHNAAPTLIELFDYYSSFLACSFAVDLLGLKITQESDHDVSKNPIIFDFKVLRKTNPRNDWAKRFLYVPQSNVGFQRSRNFVMQFMTAFCELLTSDFLINFVSTLLNIYEYYKTESLNPSFICQDALTALLMAVGSTSKILDLANRIFDAKLGEAPLKSRLLFAARLRREVANQGQGFVKAYTIATNWVLEGGEGGLALIAILASKLPSLKISKISEENIYKIGEMIVSAFSVVGDRPEFSNLIDNASDFLTSVIASNNIVRREDILTETLVGLLLVASERKEKIDSEKLEILVMNWTRAQVNNLSLHSIIARRYNITYGDIPEILMTALNTFVVGHQLTDPQFYTTARIFGDILSDARTSVPPGGDAKCRHRAYSESKSLQFFVNAYGHPATAPQFDYAIANCGKPSGVLKEIDGVINTFYAREDMTLVMPTGDGMIGSSVFGSFSYKTANPKFILNIVDTSGLFYNKTMETNKFVSLAKHFLHRTQRRLIIISVLINDSKVYYEMLESLGVRVASKDLPVEITHKFNSKYVFIRRTNRADIIFDTDCDSNFVLSLGENEVKDKDLIIYAHVILNGVISLKSQSTQKDSIFPIAERKILSKRDTPIFIVETILQAVVQTPEDREARVSDFKQSWSFITQKWL